MGQNKTVASLHSLIVETRKQIDELEWEGDLDKADFLKKYLAEYQEMADSGEVYYPLF